VSLQYSRTAVSFPRVFGYTTDIFVLLVFYMYVDCLFQNLLALYMYIDEGQNRPWHVLIFHHQAPEWDCVVDVFVYDNRPTVASHLDLLSFVLWRLGWRERRSHAT